MAAKNNFELFKSAISAAEDLMEVEGPHPVLVAKMDRFKAGGHDPLDWPDWDREFDKFYNWFRGTKSQPTRSAAAEAAKAKSKPAGAEPAK